MSWKSVRAIRVAVTIVAVSAFLASSKTSHALPTLLTQAQFNTAAGGSAVVEDFEGFGTGSQGSPFVFANGRYTATGPSISNSGTFGPTKVLFDNSSISGLRTFDLFPLGTTLVGMDLFYISDSDLFNVIVTGGSGVLNSVATGTAMGTFLGFQDALGISSISFQNLGTAVGAGTSFGNYSFDNIQTASGSDVPEPTSMALFGLTALGMGFAARRRRLRKGNPIAAGSPA